MTILPTLLRATFAAFCLLVCSLQFSTAGEPPAVLRPAETAKPSAPAADADETLVLSPFTVSSERDTGYAAANTLAGTRLNTPVRDLGSSISIYTKDFLNDIGATNANELLVYATGMEAAGAQGNFSGVGNDINADRIIGESTRARPQNQTRTRGLAAPNFTRGFFTTDIPFDSYNSDAVTVNRGPNAILFGVGSPAGVVDASPIRPNLNRNQNRFEARFGNNVSARGSLDLNRMLVPGKLAFRLAALEDREAFNQRPAFEEKRRGYGAVTYDPFRSTSIRASFETGRTHANRPISVLPSNSIAPQWYAAGQPVHDWTFYDDPARNPDAAAQNAGNFINPLLGVEQRSDQVAMIYSQRGAPSPLPDLAYRVVFPNTTTNAANSIRNAVFHPVVNRDLAADTINATSTRNIAEIPAVAWPGGQVPAGIKFQGFTDYDVFDFQNRLLDESSRQDDGFHSFNVAFEQRAWRDRIGLELAYDTQRYDTRAKNSFFSAQQVNNVRVETTVTLPNGEPNPNLGRPFIIFGQANWTNNFAERATWRATPYLRYDFKDASPRLGRWLGRHTLTGLYEHSLADSIGYSYRLATTGPVADAINPSVDVFARRPGLVVYIGDSVLGGKPVRLQPITIPELTGGITFPTTYFAAPAGSAAQGNFAVAPTTTVELNSGGTATREVIKSQAAVLQSNWLADHAVTILGWRRDEDYFERNIIAFVPNPANTADPGKVHYGFNDFSFTRTPPPNAAKEITSYSVVLRWPRKLLPLPRGTDLSIFHNSSQNFTPIGGRVDAYNNPLDSPEGKTKEFGLNLSLFSDQLSLRVNRFETSVVGQGAGSSLFGNATVNAIGQTASFWAIEQNVNPQINRAADIELLYSRLPANYRDLYPLRVTGTAAQQNLSSAFAGLAGRADTTDFAAKGIEFEVVYNPTHQWRILANAARQETIQTNSMPGLREFIARMTPVWTQLSDRPRGNYPAGFVIGRDTLPATTETFGSWLQSNIFIPFATANATEGSVSAEQRKWRLNVVSNYDFARASRLRGWSLGGGARWQDKIGIGYPVSLNPDSSVKIDIAHPYYARAELNIDAWIGYKRKLFNDRIEWRAQFNVRNLIGGDDPIAITVQPWGEVASARLPPERRWYLTNTFSF